MRAIVIALISMLMGLTLGRWLDRPINSQTVAEDANQLRVAQRASVIMGNDPHVVFEVRSNGDGTFRVVLDPRAVQTDILLAFQGSQR